MQPDVDEASGLAGSGRGPEDAPPHPTPEAGLEPEVPLEPGRPTEVPDGPEDEGDERSPPSRPQG